MGQSTPWPDDHRAPPRQLLDRDATDEVLATQLSPALHADHSFLPSLDQQIGTRVDGPSDTSATHPRGGQSSTGGEGSFSVLADWAGWRRVVLSAACYDDALAEAGEGGQSVGAALDHLDLVDDAFGVAVGGRFVEVGQQLVAPDADALGEGVEGGQAGALDRGEEGVEALFGAAAVGGPVDGAEGLLESPRLGDQRLVGEQLDRRRRSRSVSRSRALSSR